MRIRIEDAALCCSDAFDLQYGVVILRLRDGLDVSHIQGQGAVFFSPPPPPVPVRPQTASCSRLVCPSVPADEIIQSQEKPPAGGKDVLVSVVPTKDSDSCPSKATSGQSSPLIVRGERTLNSRTSSSPVVSFVP